MNSGPLGKEQRRSYELGKLYNDLKAITGQIERRGNGAREHEIIIIAELREKIRAIKREDWEPGDRI